MQNRHMWTLFRSKFQLTVNSQLFSTSYDRYTALTISQYSQCNISIQQDDDDDDDNQKTPNLFLRQASSGAQVQFSDNEEVTMETVGLNFIVS